MILKQRDLNLIPNSLVILTTIICIKYLTWGFATDANDEKFD